jgi:hypothetical protein
MGGAGSFDSDFKYQLMNERTNAELTINLSVFLRQRAPGPTTDSDGAAFTAIAWDDKSWAVWKKRFQREAQAFWHGRYWLKTPTYYKGLQYPLTGAMPTHRCNVWCRFKLDLAASAAGAHKTIEVVRLAPMKKGGTDPTTFRSDADDYTNWDLASSGYTFGKRVYHQRTFIHEIGHALGLPHIGVLTESTQCAAVTDKNTDVCYGVTNAERREVMGYGEALTAREARPWVARLVEHLELAANSGGDWAVSRTHAYPVRIK